VKLFLITLARPNVEDVDVFDIPSKPAGVKYVPGGQQLLFPHGEDFWTIPLYHN
jgi:hypothetical protein